MKFVDLPDPISLAYNLEIATSINVGGAPMAAITYLKDGSDKIVKQVVSVSPERPIGIRIKVNADMVRGDWGGSWLTEDEAREMMRALAQALQRVSGD